MDIVGKRLTNVRIHAGYHVEGVGSIPMSLDTGALAKWKKDLSMIKTPTGVMCTVKKESGGLAGFFIPDTNCIGMTVDMTDFQQEKKESKK